MFIACPGVYSLEKLFPNNLKRFNLKIRIVKELQVKFTVLDSQAEVAAGVMLAKVSLVFNDKNNLYFVYLTNKLIKDAIRSQINYKTLV